MASRHTRVSRRMLFTWFMLGGLILLFSPRGLTGKLQLGFASVFRWPLSLGRGVALSTSTDRQLADTVPRREYTRMEIHASNLGAKLRQQEEKFRKLSAMYEEYDAWEGVDFALAKVITGNARGARNELTVKYTRDANLVKGQFVLGDNGIVGRISDASAGTAHVMLITDPESAIGVKIGKLNLTWLMQGSGDNSARIQLVEKEYNVKVGDKVFASEAGTKFLDAPMTVGTVDRCVTSRKDPLMWDITVKPVCDIEKLESVTVIIMDSRE